MQHMLKHTANEIYLNLLLSTDFAARNLHNVFYSDDEQDMRSKCAKATYITRLAAYLFKIVNMLKFNAIAFYSLYNTISVFSAEYDGIYL